MQRAECDGIETLLRANFLDIAKSRSEIPSCFEHPGVREVMPSHETLGLLHDAFWQCHFGSWFEKLMGEAKRKQEITRKTEIYSEQRDLAK